MSKVFQSEATLALYALRRDEGCHYARGIADWTRELSPWRHHPALSGYKLDLLGLTPAEEISLPEDLEALVVEPLPRSEAEREESDLEPLIAQLREDQRITGLLLRQLRPSPKALRQLLGHPWTWLDLGELSLDDESRELAELGSLRGLRFSGAEASLSWLQRTPVLEALSLTGLARGGFKRERAQELPTTIQQLAIADWLVEGAADALAARLGKLRTLRVTAEVAEDLAHFASCPLETLEMRAHRHRANSEPHDIDYASLIPSFPALKQLSLDRAMVEPRLLEALVRLDGLQALRLSAAKRKTELGGALPNLVALDLQLDLDARDVEIFDGLDRLEALRIQSSNRSRERPPRAAGMSLKDWSKLCDSNRSERLPLCALLDLPAPERLRRLALTGLSLQPNDEEVFAEFPNLEALSVRDMPLRRIDPIAGLETVRELQLDGTWIELRDELASRPLRSLSLRSTMVTNVASIAALSELEALAIGEIRGETSTHAPLGLEMSEAPVPGLISVDELKLLEGGVPALRSLLIAEIRDGDRKVSDGDLASLCRAHPRLLSFKSRSGDQLSVIAEFDSEVLRELRASYAQDPEALKSVGKELRALNIKLASARQLSRLRKVDEETLTEGCLAIWEDVLSIEEIAAQPEDEVAALLDFLGL